MNESTQISMLKFKIFRGLRASCWVGGGLRHPCPSPNPIFSALRRWAPPPPRSGPPPRQSSPPINVCRWRHCMAMLYNGSTLLNIAYNAIHTNKVSAAIWLINMFCIWHKHDLKERERERERERKKIETDKVGLSCHFGQSSVIGLSVSFLEMHIILHLWRTNIDKVSTRISVYIAVLGPIGRNYN